MELYTAETGLISWTILCLFSLVLSITASISIVRNDKIERKESLGWILVVFFIPLIGPIVYFTKSRNTNKYA